MKPLNIGTKMRDTETKQNVIVKADSINAETGDRATTLLLTRFPYTLIQEAATHRLISQGTCNFYVLDSTNPFTELTSRSSASTRAIPVERLIQSVINDPFIPNWSKHQKGMSGIEDDDAEFKAKMSAIHKRHMWASIVEAREMVRLGAHKQHINDILKPFLRIPILVTATQNGWNNFIKLRTDKSCRVEFREYALEIKKALEESQPEVLQVGQVHMPFKEVMHPNLTLREQKQVASARCARLSYSSHDGVFSLERDLELFGTLLREGHMGPFEHILTAVSKDSNLNLRTFVGFYSFRAEIEDNNFLV